MNRNAPAVFAALGNIAALEAQSMPLDKGNDDAVIAARGRRRPRHSTAKNRKSKYGSKAERRMARAKARSK